MDNGYIKLFRKMLSWEWFTNATALQLFICLLLLASRKPEEETPVPVGAGQVLTTLAQLMEYTGQTKQQVRSGLAKLMATQQITQTTTHRFSLITIANWASYQETKLESTQKSTQTITQSHPPPLRTPPYIVKIEKDIPSLSPPKSEKEKARKLAFAKSKEMFERLWLLYPKKLGKAEVTARQKYQLYQLYGEEQLERAIARYKKHIEEASIAHQFIMYGGRFFNAGFQDYLDEVFEKSEREEIEKIKKGFVM